MVFGDTVNGTDVFRFLIVRRELVQFDAVNRSYQQAVISQERNRVNNFLVKFDLINRYFKIFADPEYTIVLCGAPDISFIVINNGCNRTFSKTGGVDGSEIFSIVHGHASLVESKPQVAVFVLVAGGNKIFSNSVSSVI